MSRPAFPARAAVLAVAVALTPRAVAADVEKERAAVVAAIDKRIKDRWSDEKLMPAPRCSDHEYLRRATLDIVGASPPSTRSTAT